MMVRLVLATVLIWAAALVRLGLSEPHVAESTVSLKRPFAEWPHGLLGNDWSERDVIMDVDVVTATGVSAYLQREYRRGGKTFVFYAGFVGGRRHGAIHHPAICFPGQGYRLQSEAVVEIPSPTPSATGGARWWEAPIRVKEFAWSSAAASQSSKYTLSTFVLADGCEPDEWAVRRQLATGSDHFTIVILSGPDIGSLGENRRVYSKHLRRLLLTLADHLPPQSTLGGEPEEEV